MKHLFEMFLSGSASMKMAKHEISTKGFPCIPHLSFFTNDIVNLEVEYKEKKNKKAGMCNFFICYKIALVLRGLRNY